MLGHQDIAEESESQFGTELYQCGDEFTLEALGIENRLGVIRSGGQKVRMVFAVVSRRL
jgi:hypothetical protein